MSPLASLTYFTLALICFYFVTRFLNKRKKAKPEITPAPTPRPLPVVNGVVIGPRTYGIPQDGIFITTVAVSDDKVIYYYESDPQKTKFDDTIVDFLEQFRRIPH